ncbi:glycosyltransferase [Aureimonas sp. AU4]|uniref:glycosyltransferase n=1 Tax=Aureimonas sp. AU4 TaxID=1638163 RepID=UPI0007848380|nr:glycosyltransferase [Aureimonas sp. AU4]
MTRFALVCPPFWSHVRAFEALGEALAARGHEATLVLNHGGAALSRSVQVPAFEIAGEAGEARRHALAGRRGVLSTVREAARRTDALCRLAPPLLRDLGAEAILADQMEPAGGLLARHLELPFVSVASALPADPDPAIPPPYLGWPFDPSPQGLKRNRGGALVAGIAMGAQNRAVRRWADAFDLAGIATLEDCFSPLGTISQTVASFDFPREGGRIFAVGPFRGLEVEEAAPLRRENGRPLVFASFGTLQGHRLGLFRRIAAACRRLGTRLAIAHCGLLTAAEAASLDADLVTDFLPQRAILREADVCVTHGGLNTAMDALEMGVPCLAIPFGFDQPGVAARLAYRGAGLALPHRGLTISRVETALARLLADPGFALAARRIGADIRSGGGCARAAAIAEGLVGAPARRLEEVRA